MDVKYSLGYGCGRGFNIFSKIISFCNSFLVYNLKRNFFVEKKIINCEKFSKFLF